jgi:hypothetical protein
MRVWPQMRAIVWRMPEREYMVLQEHLDALCPELRMVVTDATKSGNRVIETWRGFGQAVLLERARPVLEGVPRQVRANLSYRPVNDPHYWLGEMHCQSHPGWFIALPYEAPDRSRHDPNFGLELHRRQERADEDRA